MELRLRKRVFGDGEFAVMTAGAVPGADIAEVGAPEVGEVHAAHPSLAIAVTPASDDDAAGCVRAGAALLVGDAFAGVAAATGAALLGDAGEHGVRADGRLVRAGTVREAETLIGAGHTVYVEEPSPALIAVYAWLGARVFRTDDVPGTRQVLDMVASIKGTRPPAVTRRGLA